MRHSDFKWNFNFKAYLHVRFYMKLCRPENVANKTLWHTWKWQSEWLEDWKENCPIFVNVAKTLAQIPKNQIESSKHLHPIATKC